MWKSPNETNGPQAQQRSQWENWFTAAGLHVAQLYAGFERQVNKELFLPGNPVITIYSRRDVRNSGTNQFILALLQQGHFYTEQAGIWLTIIC
jgi:hypothetical protein